ncbi:MAG: GDP-L-fucose synthase [Gammaproteobacteria bacterium]|nr:GDP-L-fucose synthase [Gammaproteobacteria bacterium]MCW8840441.1 GDP-L-fucose synthase [Gammaproteobacteria bacterium]MCW8959137.1 GDP-L-fucose synthase [Gammaproteobacteria bacterium]MCW8993308.1 GDP-L-fucose synthase [Gammaproteobacteria bacterium]
MSKPVHNLDPAKRIYVAGHRGLVGSAVVRRLKTLGFHDSNIITRTHSELDLTNQQAVSEFFVAEKIDYVVLAAAKVGGIHANNTYPAEFIYQNLMMEANVIHQAYLAGVQRLLFLGSSCIYPRLAAQPMAEDSLLTGTLEPTNEPYALAKIAGIKLCESYNRQYGTDYRSVMPTNLYGENDNFDLNNSHVIPALLRKFHDAKQQGDEIVEVWGTGNAMREFLHVDDMADASLYVLGLDHDTYANNTHPMLSHINVGTGVDVTIRELAETVAEAVGYAGTIYFDTSKPDGAPRKLLDVSRLTALGWQARLSLKEGLSQTYQWYLEHSGALRT